MEGCWPREFLGFVRSMLYYTLDWCRKSVASGVRRSPVKVENVRPAIYRGEAVCAAGKGGRPPSLRCVEGLIVCTGPQLPRCVMNATTLR